MRQETLADDDEVRMLEHGALVQCTAGTRLGVKRGLHLN